MDILLSHGYFLSQDPHEQKVMKPYPPLGILYITSYLKSRGFDVEVFDSTFQTPERFEELLKIARPPVVGLYCNLMTRQNVVKMIQTSKACGAAVIVGGPEPANYPGEYLARGADIVVDGEGELTLEQLIPHLRKRGLDDLSSIPGIIYLDERGTQVRTLPRAQIQDLNEQPFPDRSAIDLTTYVETWQEHHGMGSVSLITARGCPYKCRWCSHSVFGYTHRRRTPDNVTSEVREIVERYQPDMLWYADDVFTINHRWLYAYQAEMGRAGLRLPFETISREDRLNEKVVQTLAEMGCFRLWIGSESGSQEILDAMERQTDVSRVRDMTRLLQKHGIQVGMFIMLGYEGDRIEQLEETVEHLKAANPDVFLTTLAYPIKGTPYFEEVSDRVVPLKSWEQGSDRDFTVAGRYSRRFYSFATRYMVSEVALHKARQNRNGGLRRFARHFLSAQIGRLGMRLTAHQRETQDLGLPD